MNTATNAAPTSYTLCVLCGPDGCTGACGCVRAVVVAEIVSVVRAGQARLVVIESNGRPDHAARRTLRAEAEALRSRLAPNAAEDAAVRAAFGARP